MASHRTAATLLAVFAACGVLQLHAAGPSVAITGATLIDGTGAPPIRDSVIVVSDGRIAAAGKFVIPGLMDANVHLVLGSSIEFVVRYEGHYEDLIEEAAQVTLKNGVTTVFDSWGPLRSRTLSSGCSGPHESNTVVTPFFSVTCAASSIRSS